MSSQEKQKYIYINIDTARNANVLRLNHFKVLYEFKAKLQR